MSGAARRDAAIGIFDSGVGGLSVLRHVRAMLPHEDLLYFADSGFAPYGEKPEQVIVARSLAIADHLVKRGVKALVVACNTATVAAVATIRARYPHLPVVGVEPGLKPAAALSVSRIVGVLATDRTLSGQKFLALRDAVSADTGVQFLLQPCTGLAQMIESGDVSSEQAGALVHGYVAPLVEQGADTLVLGCTHYPFARELIERCAAREIAIVDTGDAIARQLARLLGQADLLRHEPVHAQAVAAVTTGSAGALEEAFSSLLGFAPRVAEVDLPH